MRKKYFTEEARREAANARRRKSPEDKQRELLKEEFIHRIPETGCWVWMGCTWSGGYGYVRVGGKHTAAHRYIYEQYVGPIPKHLDACHTCDIPCCVNPDHIWPGTVSENMKDAYAKGRRSQAGVNNSNYRHGRCIKSKDL